ncbi:hypothetical protein HYH03_014736 [Edaphochlamys debaryana]|uniref:cyclin-dependent kinase n=1 Tax=Edaphochlamys debaryana TaxID=47281 RepID=A0A836BRM0_9CHLO|nr:hypothetical protein HYH03_014736 [Edaphochlamys debaryana]|eukprot:KAG2486566.1 hypothetical protein HYH03_014736 [Edaphochlamys debaryana]
MAEGRPQTESCADTRQRKGTVGDYAQLRPLGEGSFSVVYECLQLSTGRRVAVKRFKDEHVDPLTRRLALRELRVLRALPAHPNVVTLLDAFRSSSGRLYMTFELLGASLVQEMHCHPRGRLPPSLLRCVAWQLLGALEHCHAHGVVHRDVKPANVLVDNVAGSAAGETAAVVKLCDFGLARWLPGREPLPSGEGGHVPRSNRPGAAMTEYVVTRWYRAPELLVGNNQYDSAVDIWSFGCLMAELATGRPLFYGASESDQLWHIVRCLGPLPYGSRALTSSSRQAGGLMKGADATSRPAAGSGGGGGTGPGGGGTAAHGYRGLAQRLGSAAEPTLLQLVGLCLALDPAARPTAAQLRQLPYFGGGLGQAPRPAPSPRPQPSAEVPPQPAPGWPLSAPARPVVVLPSSQPNPPPAAAAAAPAAPAAPAAAAATSSSLPAPAPAAGAGDQLPRARASANAAALASAPGAVTAAASAAVSGGGGSADCGPRVLLGDGVERGQLSISMSASGHVRGMGAAPGVTAGEVWHAASQIQSGATDAAVGDAKGPEEGQGADGGLASASAETSAEAPRQVRQAPQARPNGSAAVAVAAAAALTAPPSPQRLLMRYAISSPQPGVPYASQPHATSGTVPEASAAAAAASQRRLAEVSGTSAAVDSAASGGLLSGAALSPPPPLAPPAPKRRGAEGRARRSEGGWGSRGVSRIVQAIGGLLPLSRRGVAGADSIGGIGRVGSPVALGGAASTGTSAAGPAAAAAAAAGRRLGGTQPRGLFNRSSLPAGPPRACTTDQAFSRPSLDSIAPCGMGAGGGGGSAAAFRSRAATAVAAATASAAAASVETMSGSMRSAMAAFLDGEDGPTGHSAAAPAAGGGGSGGGEYGTSVVPSRSLHGVLMEEDEPAENGEDVWEDLNATGMRLRSSSQSVHRQRAGRAPRTVSRGMSAGGGSRSGPAASAADAAAVAAQGWVAVVSSNPAAAAAPASVSQPGGLAALAAAATAAAQSASAGGGRQTRSSLAAAVSRMLNVVSGGAGGGGGDDGGDEGRTSRLRRMAYVKSNSSVTDTEEPIAADSRWHPGESVAAGVWGSGSAGMEPGAGHLAAAGPPTAVLGRSSLASVHEMETELVEAAPAPTDEGGGAPLGTEEGGRVDGGGGAARRGFGRGLAKALARRVKKALGSGS